MESTTIDWCGELGREHLVEAVCVWLVHVVVETGLEVVASWRPEL